MLALILRDPLLGSPAAIVRVLIALLLGTSVAEGIRAFAATASNGAMPGPFANRIYVAAALWLAPAILLLLSKTRERCRSMDLALPIEARRLWMAHTQTIWLLGLVLLTAGAGILWSYAKIVYAIPGKIPVPDQNLGLLVIPPAVSLLLVVAALQSFRPGLQQVPADRSYRAVALLTLGGGLGLGIGLSALPWFASLLPLVFAIGLTARTFRSVPPSFAMTPREVEAASEPARNAGTQEWERHAETGSGTGLAARWSALYQTHRILLCKKLPGWVLYLLLFGWGVFASGFPMSWSNWEEGVQLTYVILTAYMLFSYIWAPMSRLYLIDALPIRRRHLFALMTLPSAAALLLGYGAGWIGVSLANSARPMVAYDRTEWPRLFQEVDSEKRLASVFNHRHLTGNNRSPRLLAHSAKSAAD